MGQKSPQMFVGEATRYIKVNRNFMSLLQFIIFVKCGLFRNFRLIIVNHILHRPTLPWNCTEADADFSKFGSFGNSGHGWRR